MAITGAVTEAVDLYCRVSLNPAFAHIWQLVFDSASAIFASFFLDQFQYQLKDEFKGRPITFQLWCIKAVLFLSLYQNLIIAALALSGIVQPSIKFQTPDLKIVLPAVLLTVELTIISILHIFAYPVKVYKRRSRIRDGALEGPETFYKGGFLGWRVIASVFNPLDFVKGVVRGFKWLSVSRMGRHESAETSYAALEDDGTGLETVGLPKMPPTRVRDL